MPYKMSYDLGKIIVTYSQDPSHTKLYIAHSTMLSFASLFVSVALQRPEKDFKSSYNFGLIFGFIP
jgi:hypothetical protein